jgi:hypothetical protein
MHHSRAQEENYHFGGKIPHQQCAGNLLVRETDRELVSSTRPLFGIYSANIVMISTNPAVTTELKMIRRNFESRQPS